MIKSSWVVIALVIATGTARAQPGATPPTEPPPPSPQGVPGATPPAPSAPPQGEMPPPPPAAEAQASGQLDLDAVIARVEAAAPTIETIARGAFRRARRSISIGPTVGLWTGAFTNPPDGVDTFATALTFGLGVELFKVPVLPTPESLKALIIERLKGKLKEKLRDRFAGREPLQDEAERFVKEIYEEVRAEVLGLENTRAKTFERPRLTLGIEANRVFDSGRWLGRLRAGIGVWKVTVGLSAAVACYSPSCDGRIELYSGPEVILHALTSKNPRASVFDAFVRWDLQATGRGEGDPFDQVVLGFRYLVDII